MPLSSILLQPLELPLAQDGSGGDTLVLDPGPRASVNIILTVTPKDPQGQQQTAQVTANVTNFVADLVMSDDTSAAQGNMKCKLETGVVADNGSDGDETGSGSTNA